MPSYFDAITNPSLPHFTTYLEEHARATNTVASVSVSLRPRGEAVERDAADAVVHNREHLHAENAVMVDESDVTAGDLSRWSTDEGLVRPSRRRRRVRVWRRKRGVVFLRCLCKGR